MFVVMRFGADALSADKMRCNKRRKCALTVSCKNTSVC